MHLRGDDDTLKLHYYKAVFMKPNYPNYATRDWSNGVTGYKVKLDEGLARELNFSYMGYFNEEELEEKLNKKVFKKPRNVNGW